MNGRDPFMIDRLKKAYLSWRAKRTGTTFRERYINRTVQLLEKGIPHPTLGKHVHGKHVGAASFSDSGRSGFNWLIKNGIQRHHVCIDFGCGSLRVGQHLIAFLEPGKYWGLDITDRFMDMGLPLMDPSVLEEKRPHLEVITPAVLESVRSISADYVFSLGVLQHIPPEELALFFMQLIEITAPNTHTLLKGRLAPERVQLSWSTWLHAEPELERIVRRLGGHIEVLKSVPRVFQATGHTYQGVVFRLYGPLRKQ